MYPADWVTDHRDRGRLVGLPVDEVRIAVKNKKDVDNLCYRSRQVGYMWLRKRWVRCWTWAQQLLRVMYS